MIPQDGVGQDMSADPLNSQDDERHDRDLRAEESRL